MWRSYAMRGVCGLTVTVRDRPYNTSEIGDCLLDREFIRRSGIEVSKKENVSSPPTCGEPP